MVKTHEINLSTSIFNGLNNNSSIILENPEDKKIEKEDYILFKQIETVDGEIQETGLYILVQVNDVMNHQGLKDGYILINYKKM